MSEAMRMKKRYVQFSKRIVVAITAAVTALCVLSVCLCFATGQMVEAVEVIKAYIGYATVVFVAYSGNSAAEKWLVSKYSGTRTDAEYSNG